MQWFWVFLPVFLSGAGVCFLFLRQLWRVLVLGLCLLREKHWELPLFYALGQFKSR